MITYLNEDNNEVNIKPLKTIIINGEKCILNGNNIVVKRGYFWFEYETYEEVKEDDEFCLNRFYYGRWVNYSRKLTDLLH